MSEQLLSQEPQTTETPTVETQAPVDGQQQSTETTWYDEVPESFRDASFVQKYKTKEDFYNGMANLTKMVGKKSDIPDFENATPEEINAFREKVGVPTEKDGYQIQTPEGFEADETFNNFLDVAHKNNINNQGANELFQMYQNEVQKMQVAMQEQQSQVVQQAFDEFYADPKANEMETNAVDLLKAVDPNGQILSPNEIGELGVHAPKVVKLLNELSNKLYKNDITPKNSGFPDVGGSYSERYAGIMERVNKGLISKEQGNTEINALTQHIHG